MIFHLVMSTIIDECFKKKTLCLWSLHWKVKNEFFKRYNISCKDHYCINVTILSHWLLMEKKIIGIDCDEVLCLLMKDFIPYMNERFDLNLKYEDLKEYDLNKYFHLNEEKVRLSIIVIDCSIGRVF